MDYNLGYYSALRKDDLKAEMRDKAMVALWEHSLDD